MHKVAPSLLMLVALLAGCAEESDPDPATGGTAPIQYQDEVVSVTVDTMPVDPPAPGERTLEKAPRWRLGEWWTYTMTDGFTGGTYEFTRVVAGEDPAAGNYLVGFPIEEFSNDVMLFHVPGYGDIAQHNLAYETHDAYFQMLDFPLTAGKSWQAEFEGTGLGLAEILAAGAGQAEIFLEAGSGYNVSAVYDAEMGEIAAMEITQGGGLYARYAVTGHGYGYEGLVRVPHAHDLIFIHGRLAGVVPVGAAGGNAPVMAPTETVEIPAGYDRASFIIAVGGGPALGLPPPAGVFSEKVTAPDGTVYEALLTPVDVATGTSLRIIAVGHDDPTGTWTLEHMAAGGGIAFVEGIGFHSIDIELPSGCVVASFNAQHHNAACTVGGDAATAESTVTGSA